MLCCNVFPQRTGAGRSVKRLPASVTPSGKMTTPTGALNDLARLTIQRTPKHRARVHIQPQLVR
jgi:hypothetical protein